MNTARPNSRPRAYVKAVVGRPLDIALINRTNILLFEYGEIPINSFVELYEYKYDDKFDLPSLGFDNGLAGYFSQLEDSIGLKKVNGVWKCYLKQQPSTVISPFDSAISERVSNLLQSGMKENASTEYTDVIDLMKKRKRHSRKAIIDGLFSPDNTILWNEEFYPLMKDRYIVSESPFETLFRTRPAEATNEIIKIKKFFTGHPSGVRLSLFGLLYTFNKRIYGTTSVNLATVQFPEIFYRHESDDDDDEIRIRCGATTTYDDLNGSKIKRFISNPDLVIYKVIASGIYQKTLLLLREVGVTDGLRLVSWHQSILNNFPEGRVLKVGYETEILNMSPLSLFQLLASRNLIVLQSAPNCKNDLRIHYPPSKIDFLDFFYKLVMKIKADRKELRERLYETNATLPYSRQLSHDTIDEMCFSPNS